jgi:hypothetical protein
MYLISYCAAAAGADAVGLAAVGAAAAKAACLLGTGVPAASTLRLLCMVL